MSDTKPAVVVAGALISARLGERAVDAIVNAVDDRILQPASDLLVTSMVQPVLETMRPAGSSWGAAAAAEPDVFTPEPTVIEMSAVPAVIDVGGATPADAEILDASDPSVAEADRDADPEDSAAMAETGGADGFGELTDLA